MHRAILEGLRKRGIAATIARGGFLLPGNRFLALAEAKALAGFDEGRAGRHHGPDRRSDWTS